MGNDVPHSLPSMKYTSLQVKSADGKPGVNEWTNSTHQQLYGLPQGRHSSPTLLNLYLNLVSHPIPPSSHFGSSLPPLSDEILIRSRSQQNISKASKLFLSSSSLLRLSINHHKTELHAPDGAPPSPSPFSGSTAHQVFL